jgi:biopolymer transport protein ExbB
MRKFTLLIVAATSLLLVLSVKAAAPEAPAPAAADQGIKVWDLFRQSFDFFTVLILAGSIVSFTVIFSCLLEIREGKLLPHAVIERLLSLSVSGRTEDLRETASADGTFVSVITLAAIRASGRSRDAIREAAELAGAEESARCFRKIEILNVIGNLGPLIGLAGTVWGMVLAFTTLGKSGGDANATLLSEGISKALFHTLLGLVLAIPNLLVYGIYRPIVDRICTRGLSLASEIVEHIPAGGDNGSKKSAA